MQKVHEYKLKNTKAHKFHSSKTIKFINAYA